MSANDESENYFLFVGRLESGQMKLYICKGSPDDRSCPLWRETRPVKMLKGDNEEEVGRAARARAHELFASPEDFLNQSKAYGKWDINLSRAAKRGYPKKCFNVYPWA